MNSIIEIIKSIDSPAPGINPTEIYNEGWMTRLLVYYSIQDKLTINSIDFSKITNWCSEAVISSPFLQRYRGDKLAEGFTHADMTIGDFTVDFVNRGEIKIKKTAKLFGIIEAKMGSNLSKGTKNAPDYNQASRNLACIASKTFHIENCKTFFSIAAPENRIEYHEIRKQIDLQNIISQIEKRFHEYPSSFRQEKNMDRILKKAAKTEIWHISYEEWIKRFTKPESISQLSDFYEKAKKWNRLN